jgi:signal transduction histidine kinase
MREEGERPFDARDVALTLEVAHRTETALARARLYRDARLAVQVRDEFLSIAAHELKTPLTALQAHIHLMMRQAGAGDLCQRGERLLRQTGRLTRLIDNLLDVSRISAGKLALQPEEFELGEVVREVAERYAEEAREAGCRLTVLVEPGVRGVWDRLRMEQVVTNLLSNALKYGAGKPVEVRLERVDGQARLWVADQGMGIAPENLERIFGVFERAVPVRHYGGLGLGLHIARQIVAAHGGDIHVRSELGQGSTFWVDIPLQPALCVGLQEVAPVI